MFLTSFITVGAAISTAISQPVIAIVVSFFANYIVSCIPHWDYRLSRHAKYFRAADFLLAIISIVLFTVYLSQYMTNNYMTTTLGTVTGNYFELNWYVVLACCIAAILPDLLSMLNNLFHKKISWLKWNTHAKNIFYISDKKFTGKIIHLAIPIVFTLYSFRILPNSDSETFLSIILIMLFVVALLAILESFSKE